MGDRRIIPVKSIPQEVNGRYRDLYEYHCSSLDGLPPHARAEAIFETFELLRKSHPWASLLVTVDGPGRWYFKDLQRYFSDRKLPICLIEGGRESSHNKFFVAPVLLPTKPRRPDFIPRIFNEEKITKGELSKLRILRPLTRMGTATTSQIASMGGFGETQTRKILKQLVRDGFVRFFEHGIEGEVNHAVWQSTRDGVLHTQWSWNIPPGTKFKKVREEQKYSGKEHHDVSRRFPAWLREAYGEAFEVWQAWTEFPINNEEIYPDALVWGTFWGFETLVWLEVESAKKGTMRSIADMVRRFDKAKAIALQQNVELIFVILTKLWLLNKIQELALFSIPGHVALVMEYSGNPGCLAEPIFGGFNSLISRYGYPKIVDLSKMLKNDPNYFLPKIRSEVLDAICSRRVSISNSESS